MATAPKPDLFQFKTSGTCVQLPVKPYPSQMSMMCRVLESLSKFKNSLIESPTGTGKTLALLSSTLAWYEAEKASDRVRKELLETNPPGLPSSPCNKEQGIGGEQQILDLQQDCDSPMSMDVSAMDFTPSSASCGEGNLLPAINPSSEDDDFEETPGSMKRRRLTETPRAITERMSFKPPCSNHRCCSNDGLTNHSAKTEEAELEKLPRIYYGTRTHKQIAQLVAELGNTPYAGIKHTILSSREQTCIHPYVSVQSKKSQACHELLAPDGVRFFHAGSLVQQLKDEGGCKFHFKLKKKFEGNANQLRGLMKSFGNQKLVRDTWDIEDLVKVGRKEKFCPYFASTRVLTKNAELIFCPYNYLIDPIIRDSMEINLKGDVVILDEAHNIEDACREAASFSLTEEDLKNCIENFLGLGSHHMLNSFSIPEDKEVMEKLQKIYHYFRGKCEQLKTWLNDKVTENSRIKNQSQDSDMGVWSGAEIVLLMQKLGWGSVESVTADFAKLGTIAKPEGEFDPNRTLEDMKKFPVPLALTLQTVEKVLHFLKLFLRDSSGIDDYKMVVEQKKTYEFEEDSPDAAGFFSKKRRRRSRVTKSALFLHFWCLNPAVTFRDAFHETRSVILASGTLCPTETFKSELGLEFSVALEAGHVLHRSRVFAATLNAGPTSGGLRCTYQRYNEFTFQDELGRLVLDVCRVVPNGVLVFLPSYFLLNKLEERWNQTGLVNQLNEKKIVIWEPRSGEQLKTAMEDFYRGARDPESLSKQLTGAVFLAVLRGKVSEGLDFADQDARAVITVGIPYPSIKDLQVDLKKEYNDAFCKIRPLLPGKVWYETQAFRALNQALGRCLRHKKDWGALIMVDERFSENPHHYCQGISKWIRKELRHYSIFPHFLEDLREFVDRLENGEEKAYSETGSPDKKRPPEGEYSPTKQTRVDENEEHSRKEPAFIDLTP